MTVQDLRNVMTAGTAVCIHKVKDTVLNNYTNLMNAARLYGECEIEWIVNSTDAVVPLLTLALK